MKVGVALPLLVWLWGQWDCHQSNKGMRKGKTGGEGDQCGVGSVAVSQERGTSIWTYFTGSRQEQ